MNHNTWQEKLLEAVADLGDEGRVACDFLRTRRTRIGFKQVRPNVGAFWTVFGNIRLNSRYYNYDTPLEDLKLKTLIIHEAHHLRQGLRSPTPVERGTRMLRERGGLHGCSWVLEHGHEAGAV